MKKIKPRRSDAEHYIIDAFLGPGVKVPSRIQGDIKNLLTAVERGVLCIVQFVRHADNSIVFVLCAEVKSGSILPICELGTFNLASVGPPPEASEMHVLHATHEPDDSKVH